MELDELNDYPFELEYAEEHLSDDEDNGTMPESRDALKNAVIGQRIATVEHRIGAYETELVITLTNGKQVLMRDSSDCCAYTSLREFFLNPKLVDHVIMGVATTEGFTRWHIYADYGDILQLQVDWSCGNPFYYGYGFWIEVVEP